MQREGTPEARSVLTDNIWHGVTKVHICYLLVNYLMVDMPQSTAAVCEIHQQFCCNNHDKPSPLSRLSPGQPIPNSTSHLSELSLIKPSITNLSQLPFYWPKSSTNTLDFQIINYTLTT